MREVVGVFDNLETLQSAIDDLLVDGFDQSEISLLADEITVREKFGESHIPAKELEDNPATPRREYVAPESRNEAKAALIGGLFYIGAAGGAFATLASGGAFAAALATAAMAGVGGGVLGGTLAALLGMREATWTQEQMSHGGILLWVRAWDAERERKAIDLMTKNRGRNVHAHTLAAVT
ncbi:MAG: hypothetical protein CTY15_07860 [Methylocystis sp.]|nr:MAG: hypothetical protein CTY15_07860 [Methylocystis sp.]